MLTWSGSSGRVLVEWQPAGSPFQCSRQWIGRSLCFDGGLPSLEWSWCWGTVRSGVGERREAARSATGRS